MSDSVKKIAVIVTLAFAAAVTVFYPLVLFLVKS